MARSKLTVEQREEIRRRRAAGERDIDLAAEYGVSKQTIIRIAAMPETVELNTQPFARLAVRSLYQGGEA